MRLPLSKIADNEVISDSVNAIKRPDMIPGSMSGRTIFLKAMAGVLPNPTPLHKYFCSIASVWAVLIV